MSNPEIKILRDELARIIAGNQKRDLLIEELMRALEEEKRAMAEVIMENGSLKRRLKIYENPHARRRTAACLHSKRRRALQKGSSRPAGPQKRRAEHMPANAFIATPA